MLKGYDGKVVHVYKHLPLNIHPWAMKAALAAEAVLRINSQLFWELRDYLFTNQNKITVDNIDQEMESFLESKNVDSREYKQKLSSPEVKKSIEEDMKEAQALGVNSTPMFFINGRQLRGAQLAAVFKKAIEEALKVVSLSPEKMGGKPAAQGKGPKLILAKTEHDFGEVDQGKTYDYIFEFTNEGDEKLVIERVTSSCGCTAVLVDANEILPGGEG